MPYRLALHPVDIRWRPAEPEELVAALRDIRLIGKPWGEPTAGRYLIGEHFLQQVTFMGCAPAIALEPPTDGGAFCHVQLQVFETPRLCVDAVHFNPRCPACGRRSPDWKNALPTWAQDPQTPVSCPLCGEAAAAHKLDFRRTAALASTFVEIHDIHPREALPTESLFAALERLGGGQWNHAYLA